MIYNMKSIKNLSVITLACLMLVSCGDKKETVDTQEERLEQVKVLTLEKSEIAREINLSAVLQGYETQNVAPSVTGKIEHIFVEEGSKVTKDQDLVTMDQLQYKTAQLTFANLGVELARVDALLKTGSATQQSYDQLKLSYDQTKENLDFLKKNTYVKAPFSGVIAAKNYEDGELYAGQPILILTQISTLKAEIAIPELYFPQVKVGMPMIIKSDIYPDREFVGTIERVFPTIDPSSHTFNVKVKIPNAKEELRPGMYVSTNLKLDKVNAIIVPYQTVLKLQGSNDRYVFINRNGVANRVPVVLGQRIDDNVEIISNEIKEGDEIVVTGQSRLVDGSKLNIVK